jgi:hypothetical protein
MVASTPQSPPATPRAAYLERAAALREHFGQVLAHLQADGTYGADPIGQAFMRSHEEPGRAWNLDQWIEENQTRHTPSGAREDG